MDTILAITGHRPYKLNHEYSGGPLTERIKVKIQEHIDQIKPSKMISGMALGIDTVFAELAILNKIPLIAAIPFLGQEYLWKTEDQNKYNKILSCPDVNKVIVCEGDYSAYKMQLRNIWMVNNCTNLLAVFDGGYGGTKNCVDYAKSKNKPIYIINPKEMI